MEFTINAKFLELSDVTDLDVRMVGIFDPIMFSAGQTGSSYSI